MNLIQSITNWKRSFLLMGIIPITFLGTIYIVYGAMINPSFVAMNSGFAFFKLSNQFDLFVSAKDFPLVVKFIGKFSVYLINFIFAAWLFTNLILTYLKLSNLSPNFFDITLEFFFLLLVFLLFISPASIIVYALVSILLGLNLALIIIYLIYFNKQNQKNEKR